MRTRITELAPAIESFRNLARAVVWRSGIALFSMLAAAGASSAPVGRPVPKSHAVSAQTLHAQIEQALPVQPWDPSARVITSEYELHEPTHQPRNQQYGMQVALSGNGRTLAVADIWYFGGSEWPWYGSGAVYVYRLASRGWVLETKLEPPAARGYDFFGSDVALSKNGDVLAVGAQNEGYDAPSQDAGPGSVFVYKRRDGRWTEEGMLRAGRAQDAASFGRSVEMSSSGDVIAVGAPYESIDVDGATQAAAGAVYVFARKAGAWVERQALSAPNPQADDLFGWGVRLSENGNSLAVLAAEQNIATENPDAGGWPNRNNVVYVFEYQEQRAPREQFQRQSEQRTRRWNLVAELEGTVDEPHFGGTAYEPEGQSEGFDLSADGRTLAVASPYARAGDGSAGVVRIYRRPGQHWLAQPTTLTPALPERRSFGLRLTLSANGRALVAFADRDDGAYGHPYVVAFDQVRSRWKQTAVFESPGQPISTGFANSLALSWSGQRLALGARTFSTNDSYWGAVLLYRRKPQDPAR